MSGKNIRNKAFKDYKKGLKMAEIAAKYDVPFNTVKSWARRHWKLKEGEMVAANRTRQDKRVQPRPHGAPKGSQNNLVHGAYVKNKLADITEASEENREVINHIGAEPKQVLWYISKLYTIYIARLLNLSSELSSKSGDENFYTSITHISYRWENGKLVENTVVHKPAIWRSLAKVERELTRVMSAHSGILRQLARLELRRTQRRVPAGTMKVVYNMLEAAKKSHERSNTVIAQARARLAA